VRTTLAALAVVGALLALPVAAHAERPSIGISDQEPSTFTDPLFGWTGISQTRIIVPWDVAFMPDTSRIDRVLQTAHNTYQDMLVSFEHRWNEDCAAAHGKCYLPNPAQYRLGVAAFLQHWPFVKTISPWNEANHPSQPTADHPATAAAYYKIAKDLCPKCTVLGAEVVDISNLDDWITRFKAALGFDPRLWGLHNYGDVTRRHGTMTRRMLELVKGDVWLTETGGLVRFELRDGSVPWPYDEQRAARALKYTFKLADAHADRIKRAYLYNWRAAPRLRWDSGLLNAAGEPRPSFSVLADRLHPGQKVPFVRRLPRARVVRKPHYRRRDGRVLTTVRCPKAHRVRCTVVLAVRTKGAKKHHGRKLLGEREVHIRAGHRRVIKVRVPRKRRRLIRIGHTRRLKAQLWLGGPRPRQFDVRCRRASRRR
jgi:polysaccharide biosynthesis protein PslG